MSSSPLSRTEGSRRSSTRSDDHPPFPRCRSGEEEPRHAHPAALATSSNTRLKATTAAGQYDQCRGRTAAVAATANRAARMQAGGSTSPLAVTTLPMPHRRAVPSTKSPAPPPTRPHAHPLPAVVLHHCEAAQNPTRTAATHIESRAGAPSTTPSTPNATAATSRGHDVESRAISYARRARARTTVGHRSESTPCIGAPTPVRDTEKRR